MVGGSAKITAPDPNSYYRFKILKPREHGPCRPAKAIVWNRGYLVPYSFCNQLIVFSFIILVARMSHLPLYFSWWRRAASEEVIG